MSSAPLQRGPSALSGRVLPSYVRREIDRIDQGIATITGKPTATAEQAERAARRSLKLLWWIPLSFLVGFLFANRFLSESWPLTQVIPLALALAAPFGVGAYYGLRAVRLGAAQGWIGLFLHVVFMLTALVMPITEAVS